MRDSVNKFFYLSTYCIGSNTANMKFHDLRYPPLGVAIGLDDIKTS